MATTNHSTSHSTRQSLLTRLAAAAVLLLIAAPSMAQREPRPRADPPAGEAPQGAAVARSLSPAASSLRIVLVNKVPWLCPEAYWGSDCTGGSPLGDLHNAALAATVGARPGRRQVAAPGTRVDTVIAGLQRWTPKVPQLAAFLQNREEMSKLTRELTERLQAIGMVDRDGRFVEGAFKDPSRMLSYLEKNGRLSPALSAAVGQSLARGTSFADFSSELNRGRWKESDLMSASVLSNMGLASAQYWGEGRSPAQLRLAEPSPVSEPGADLARRRAGSGAGQPSVAVPHVGFWDMTGALLLIESGPGSVIGGYLLSCAAAGEWL